MLYELKKGWFCGASPFLFWSVMTAFIAIAWIILTGFIIHRVLLFIERKRK